MWDINRDDKKAVAATCPQCGDLMANMGLDFESPKQNEIKSWEHIHNLYSVISDIPYELRPKKGSISNEDARNYWIDRIKEVELKLNKIRAAAS